MATDVLQDKIAILNVFAKIMEDPTVIDQGSEYTISLDDFPSRFHKMIFAAMVNLRLDGVEKITPIEVDGYLNNLPAQYAVFNDMDGLQYLENLQQISETENFPFHYETLRKFTLLRAARSIGIDTSDIYDDTEMDLRKADKQRLQFDSMSINDIVREIESKVVLIKEQFETNSNGSSSKMSDNLLDILEDKRKNASFGENTVSGYLNAIIRGMLKKKFTLFSGDTGSGKSRFGLANLLSACVPVIYDSSTGQWIKTGAQGKGVFISTELEEEEVKLPAACYIADVDESKIHRQRLTDEEYERLKIAAKILDENIWFEELMDFDIADIENCIQRHVVKHEATHICFDYIHSSLKILTSLSKAGAKNLREDQILLLMGIAIKNICNKYNVHIMSGTQLNNNYKTAEGFLDQSSIRGGKALADKVDVGAILLPIDKKDEAIIESVKHLDNPNFVFVEPTHTINIYKNRGNTYKMCKIFVNFNMGSLRLKDCFVTFYHGGLIENVKPIFIERETGTVSIEEILGNENTENQEEQNIEMQSDDLPDFEEGNAKFAF